MDDYNKYMEEIQLFDCKTVNPLKDPSMAGNYIFNYLGETDDLRKRASANLPGLTSRKINQHLKKLKQTLSNFQKYDGEYPQLIMKSKSGLLTMESLKKQMAPLELRCSNMKQADEAFMILLYDTFRYRLRSLVELINKTEDFMAEKSLGEHRPYG